MGTTIYHHHGWCQCSLTRGPMVNEQYFWLNWYEPIEHKACWYLYGEKWVFKVETSITVARSVVIVFDTVISHERTKWKTLTAMSSHVVITRIQWSNWSGHQGEILDHWSIVLAWMQLEVTRCTCPLSVTCFCSSCRLDANGKITSLSS